MLLTILKFYLVYTLVRLMFYICSGFLYKEKSTKKMRNYSPLVSVIIPAWNEEVGIVKTISSVMSNGYQNLEVICVDDGSTDNTSEKILKARNRYWKNKDKIILLKQANQGKAIALNNGIKASKGEIVITIDADSYITKGTIRKLVNSFSDGETSVSIGKIVVGNRSSFLGLAQYFEYKFGFHYKQTQDLLNSIYIFPGALTAFKKSVVEEVGYFESHSSTEDLDLSMKIKLDGHKVKYVNDAICVTEGATDLKGLLNQRTRWRHGYIQCLLKRKEFITSRSKGNFLTFVELPLALIGILEVLIYPFLFAYLLIQLAGATDPSISLITYLLLPYIFILSMNTDEKLKGKIYLFFVSLAIPILFAFINFVELFSLYKSIYRTILGKETKWTVWERKGTI